MSHTTRLSLTLIISLSAVLILGLLLTPQLTARSAPRGPAACTTGAGELRVPDNCATIQDAIDAIADQGTIRILETTDAASTYFENLVITRPVVLWGGWDAAYANSTGQSTLNAQRLGRGVTISGSEELMVVLRGLTIISGTADGLGGLTVGSSFTLTEYFSGTAPATTDFVGLPGDDCGGGVYARNSHLLLYNVTVQDNLASASGRGLGGGVCSVDAPYAENRSLPQPFEPGLTVMENSIIRDNIASTGGPGAGGGIFVANTASDVTLWGADFTDNVGSTLAAAYGGGILAIRLDVCFLTGSTLSGNIASQSGNTSDAGRGGGAALVDITHLYVPNTTFSGNIAASGARGYGGGLYVSDSSNTLELRQSTYSANIASTAPAGAGYGGGLYVEHIGRGDNNFVRLNTFQDNVAATSGQGGGGGAFFRDAPELKVLRNTFRSNHAVASATQGAAFGGGLALIDTFHPMIENNQILSNSAAAGGTITTVVHRGGGLYVLRADDVLIGDNTILTNTAAVNLPGEGGGLYLADSATERRALRVVENWFASNAASQGGGVLVRDASEVFIDHNRFMDNDADSAHLVGDNLGGGLLIQHTVATPISATVSRNRFFRNAAQAQGGGVALDGVITFTLENNVFAENAGTSAAGLYLKANATDQASYEAANNTFHANTGPAIEVDGWSDPAFTAHNTLISEHAVGVQAAAGTTVTLDYTLWYSTPTHAIGTVSDLHPVNGDPAFVNSANDDYHLQIMSAARDAGDPAGIPPAPQVDLAYATRPFGDQVDIGAYEWRDAVHWPYDYPTLEEAIDAARPGDGDTIYAVGQGYGGTEEHLRITKSITLSGGWDPEFTGRNPKGPTFWINQPGVPGRLVTIEGGPGVVVKIEGFSFSNGDATGLGGVAPVQLAALRSTPTRSADAATAVPSTDVASPATIRATMTQLQTMRRVPAEAAGAIEQLLDRLGELEQLRPTDRSPAAPSADPDCGGAIYSTDAGFYLSESYFEKNFASKSNDGYGGAVCVINAPAGQLEIDTVEMRYNTASVSGRGQGGAIFISSAPQARLTNLHLLLNVASAQGSDGAGGGLAVLEADGIQLINSVFDGNVSAGTWGAMSGTGGGAEIWESPNALVTDNLFRSNLGGSMCMTCRGGGLNLGKSVGVTVANNTFKYNLAGMVEWPVGLSGGGLALDALSNSQIVTNTFINNSAGVAGGHGNAGGGLYGIALDSTLVADNVFTSNWGSQEGFGHGGGAYFEPAATRPSQNLTIRRNTFTGNAGSLSGIGVMNLPDGGGLGLYLTTNSLVQHNLFDGNVAAYDSSGIGGGLSLRAPMGGLGGDQVSIDVVVDGNTFIGNVAEASDGVGGGLVADAVKDYTLINNVFAHNRAGGGGALSLSVPHTTVGPFSGLIMNNTLYDNHPDGLFLYGSNQQAVAISNTIVVSQNLGVNADEGTHVLMAYTLWNDVGTRVSDPNLIEDVEPVTGPVNFVDAAAGDFRLQITSAARDAGDPAGVPPAPNHDFAGTARPFGARVDIGAYEWLGYQLHVPLVAHNHCAWAACVGWAVGDQKDGYGTILHTTDGGESWVRQGAVGQVPGMTLVSVSAASDRVVYVAAERAILKTTDGGQTWVTQTLPTDLPEAWGLGWIKALSEKHAVAVGVPGLMWETLDGSTWTTMTMRADVPLAHWSDVDAADATHIWAVGTVMSGTVDRLGRVIAFYDGTEWVPQAVPPDPTKPECNALIGLSVVDTQTAWAVGGANCTALKTTDGATWQLAGDLDAGGYDVNRVVAWSAQQAWMSADNWIRVTLDGGQTYTSTALAGQYFYGMSAASPTLAWATAISPMAGTTNLYRTVDGLHWVELPAPVQVMLGSVSFVGARR